MYIYIYMYTYIHIYILIYIYIYVEYYVITDVPRNMFIYTGCINGLEFNGMERNGLECRDG